MAIANLADLKTAITNYSQRGDWTDTELTDFVTLFEARANIDLAIRTAEVDTTLTGTISSRSLTLPSDFLEPIALFLTTYGVEDPMALVIAGNQPLDTFNSVPRAWMINGSSIDLDVPCNEAHTFKFRYRMKLLNLASTDPNFLLTNYPNVYLFGCLVEQARFLKRWTEMAAYEAQYQQAKDAVAWLQARSKSRAPLRVDAALVAPRRFSINSGD